MARIEVLVGMIASGKSTYCRDRAAQGAVIVNDDLLVAAVHGGAKLYYDKSLKPLYKMLEDVTARLALSLGKDVVIDRPNLCRRTRQKYIQLARECDAEVVAVVFPKHEPEVHAERRFHADNRGKDANWWVKVAKAHAAEWEPVALEEGFLEIREIADLPF